MGKKATKKLLKKLKGSGQTKQIKGAKSQKVKHAKAKKPVKAVSLATVLKHQNQKKRKRKRTEQAENGVAKTEAAFDIETASSKEKGKKVESDLKLEDMSLDDFLAGGFKTVLDHDSDSDDDAVMPSEEADLDSNDDEEEEKEDNEEEVENKTEDEDVEEKDGESSDDEDEMDNHMKDLEKLKESDPEFYAHLKKNAADLLEFGQDEIENKEDNSGKPAEKKKTLPALKQGQKLLTSALLKRLQTEAFEKKSYDGLKEIASAFKAGTRIADDEVGKEENNLSSSGSKYVIYNPGVLQKVMITTIRKFHAALDDKLNLSKLKPGQLPKESRKWKRQERFIKRFLLDVIHLLKNSTDPSMLRFVLQNCKNYGKFFACFPDTIANKYLKVLLRHFGSNEDEIVRIAAFLRIRQLAVEGPSNFVEKCMKGAYLAFVREAKFAKSEHTAERVAIQAKCLVELFGVDLVAAYGVIFVYLRQLSLILRAALLSKSEESIKSVYCWQFIHCLKLWGAVLSTYPGINVIETNDSKKVIAQHEQQLRPLIYPFIQVVIGTIRLVPASKYYPLRLHLVNVLNALSRTSRYFIPTAPLILDILQTNELFDKKPVATTKAAPDLNFTLRLKKKELRTGVCQQEIVANTLEALENYFECYKLSVGFPEMIFPSLVTLKNFSRKTRVTRWRSEIRELVAKLTKWSDRIKSKRATVSFGPANVTRAAAFSSALEREDHESNLLKKNKAENEITLDQIENQPKDSPSDEESDDDMDDEEHKESKKQLKDNAKEKAKKKQKVEKVVVGTEDVVEDMLELSSSDEE